MNSFDVILSLFKDYYGFPVESIEKLAGAGSNRMYYRLKGMNPDTGQKISCIGVVGDDLRECASFVKLSNILGSLSFPVPKVYAFSSDFKYYIQEDLGTSSLLDFIKTEDGHSQENMLKDVLRLLAKLQTIPFEYLEEGIGYSCFSKRQIMWDFNYFKYEYLKPLGFEFDENALEDDFELLADSLLKISDKWSGFMYRDFQSRNILIKEGFPYFIDFQGGRKGPGIYDAVSLLWQSRAGFDYDFRIQMLDEYLKYVSELSGESFSLSLDEMLHFALFRTLQVLGAYGFRGVIEKKATFIESIPAALANLRELYDKGVLDNYPELKRISLILFNDPRFVVDENYISSGGLMVEVFSFSYKKGYPSDFSGNGGGYMFDCRGMHNPGRYQEYKSLTGRDKPVVDFLEQRGECQDFIKNAFELTKVSLDSYIRRGFRNLQIGFGCTGGQHRSVYCAENYARLIKSKYPDVKVRLTHREQGIETFI